MDGARGELADGQTLYSRFVATKNTDYTSAKSHEFIEIGWVPLVLKMLKINFTLH